MKLKRPLLFPLLCVLAVLFSCSRAEPEIIYGFIELVYYPGSSGPEERYSFFILPQDDDGVDNLSELYLYNDREGLRWLLTSNDWIKYVAERQGEAGNTWIGSRGIAMQDNGTLPRGQYRAVLVNKGGERTERRFTYDGPETSPYPFPQLSIGDGMYRIESEYPVNTFVCYDQQGQTVITVQVTDKEGSIGNLRLSSAVRTIALWAEDPVYRISAITEAAAIR